MSMYAYIGASSFLEEAEEEGLTAKQYAVKALLAAFPFLWPRFPPHKHLLGGFLLLLTERVI